MMKKLIIALLAPLLLLTACNSGNIYEKYIDNDRITWNRFDVKTFKVDIKDITAKYSFYVAIRHLTDIPFSYITISFTLNTPSGETRNLEKKIVLKDNDGKLLGNGMGDLWDITQLVRDNFEFSEPGICTVEISSTMPQANLPGIMQVGLIVKKCS
jgi:gliding motility-associated lipoprotein GldH